MRKLKILIILFTFFITIPTNPISNSRVVINQDPETFIVENPSIDSDTLDPASFDDVNGIGCTQLMYEGLYQYANNSVINFKPDLATGYIISSDGLTYTFTIRTGVTFALQPGETAGQPFNAYVMQYSIDRAIIMNDPYGSASIIQDWIKGAQKFEGNAINLTQAMDFLALKSVWAVDATHLQITLRTPFGGFLSTLLYPVSFAVSPKAIIDNKPNSYTTNPDPIYGMVSLASLFPGISNYTILSNLGLVDSYEIDDSGIVPQSGQYNSNAFKWFKDHSAGTGPYKLDEYIPDNHIYFVKNTNWWDSAEFHPNSPNNIKIIQEPDDTTRIQKFKDGTIDFTNITINFLEHFGITSTHPISNTSGINAYVGRTLQNIVLGMNQADFLGSDQVIENPITSNYNYGTKNVSDLLKYSWNYPNGSKIMASSGNPFSSLLFREAFAYSFNYDQYVNQLTNGFGIRMQGAIPQGLLGHNDNLISNGNIPSLNLTKAKELFNQVGWKGSVSIYYPTGILTKQLSCIILKNEIESLNIGISINVIEITSNTYVNFDQVALFGGIGTANYADPNTLAPGYYQGGVGLFAILDNYNNPEVNSLIEAGTATTSPSERDTIYQQMEVNASGDYPYIYLCQPLYIYLMRDWIVGVDDPASNTLNPMIYYIPVQFLGKVINNVSLSQSKSLSFSTSAHSIRTRIPGFTVLTIGSTTIALLLITKHKRKQ